MSARHPIVLDEIEPADVIDVVLLGDAYPMAGHDGWFLYAFTSTAARERLRAAYHHRKGIPAEVQRLYPAWIAVLEELWIVVDPSGVVTDWFRDASSDLRPTRSRDEDTYRYCDATDPISDLH